MKNKLSRKDKCYILAALRRLAVGIRSNSYAGICNNLQKDSLKDRNIPYGDYLESFYSTWPEYTGVLNFPVPNPDYPYDPEEGYYRSEKWTGDTGESRMRLLAHLISEIKLDLSK